MRTKILLGGLLLGLAGMVQATIVVDANWSSSFTEGTGVIADSNPTGWHDTRTFSGLDGNDINNVTVRLNITGGYNGDLYGYLVHHDSSGNSAGFSILLNRVGTGTPGEPTFTFGFSTAGFNNVTLSDGAGTSIHDVADPTGGTYATDGGSLGDFNEHGANGTWTLFLADMSGGEQSTVASWGLEISVVPEPVTWAVAIFAALVVGIEARRRRMVLRTTLHPEA